MPMNPLGLLAASAQGTGTQYTMNFINNSVNSWNFCCYQKDPGILAQGAFSAAWFVAQTVHPTTQVKFSWTIDYGLSWAQSGTIGPGIIYDASQNWAVTYAQNTVTLTKSGCSYTFENLREQEPTNAFMIVQNGTVVPQDGVGVGISMVVQGSGASGLNTIYAQPAQPNITTQFYVTPKYYVVFAQNLQASEILDVQNMTNTVEVPYAPGVTSMVATLSSQNEWRVGTTAALNAAVRTARATKLETTMAEVAEDAHQVVTA